MQQPIPQSSQRVGGDLRAARERLGWSLSETSSYLRIKRPFLVALEEGRTADLPGGAYAVGFVRSYARALGVDAEETVRRFREEAAAHLPPAPLNFPTPMPQRHVPAGAVVLLGAMLAIVGYVGWYRASGDRAGTVPVQQVPARLAPLALPPAPPPPGRTASSANPVIVAHLPPRFAVASTAPGLASPSAAEASVPAPGSLLPVDPAPAAAQPGAAVPADQIALSATADAWVQVKTGEGTIVLSKVMHAGDRWIVPDRAAGAPPMMLTTGNAGGTQITIGQQPLPPLGGSGAVRRDVALDPAQLRAQSSG